ncbi:ADP-ribosylation factor protein 1 [Sparganum proliferum]
MIQNKALEGLPLLILANKQDLDGAFPVSEVKQVFQESAHLIGHRDCSMRGASALLGDGVDDGIRWMAQKVRKNSCMRPPNTDDQGF